MIKVDPRNHRPQEAESTATDEAVKSGDSGSFRVVLSRRILENKAQDGYPMQFGCRGVAAKCGSPWSPIFRRRRRGASLFDKFNANSAIFCPNELRPSSHVAVPCHNQEKILRGHPRIDQTKQMNPRAAGRNIFQTAFYRPRSIAPYNHGVERSIKADPLLGPLVSGHLRSRSVRRRPGENAFDERNVINEVMTALYFAASRSEPPISRITRQHDFDTAEPPTGAPDGIQNHPRQAPPRTPGTSKSPPHSPAWNQRASRPPLS